MGLLRPDSCRPLRNVAVVDDDCYSAWHGLMCRTCGGDGGHSSPLCKPLRDVAIVFQNTKISFSQAVNLGRPTT